MPSFIVENVATINFILINVALAMSIYVTLSTGLLTLANAGFMAIGAYTAAIVVTQTRLPLAVGFALALLMGVVVAVPFGLLVLRLRDLYLAIATLGFGEIVRLIALNGDTLIGPFQGSQAKPVFNGGEGITLPYVSPPVFVGLPVTTWVLIAYVLATVYVLATLHYSHPGRVLAAIRLDEAAAGTMGVDVVRYKLITFALGAAIAAGSGALAAPIVRVVDPSSYTFGRAVDILAFSVLGGMTHWVGPIVGATVLTALPESLRFLKDQRVVVNGVIIMVSIIYLPRGLADPRFWKSLVERRTSRPVREVDNVGSRDIAPLFPSAHDDGPRSADPLLVVQDASRLYGGLAALDHVNFQVRPGTVCGLIGPNGAGKTTLINAISGLTRLSSGKIVFDGTRIDAMRVDRIAALGIGRTFQNIRLFADLSVLENVMLGYHARRRAGVVATVLQFPGGRREDSASRESARALLKRLGMEHLAGVEAGTLSYGDQRRVEIARAVAMEPRILLLDEPAAGMNAVETDRLSDFLLELKQIGLTLLVIEHDMGLIMRVSDEVVVLNFGRKIAQGSPAVVRADPQVVGAYLGDESPT